MVASKAAKIEKPAIAAEPLAEQHALKVEANASQARTKLSLAAWDTLKEEVSQAKQAGELENFFGFNQTENVSRQETFNFTDSTGKAVSVSIGKDKVSHRSSDNIETVKDMEGVIRRDTKSETHWCTNKIEVSDLIGNKHFTQTAGKATLDWGHYEIEKSGPDKYLFIDKTGQRPVCEYDGDVVRKQVGPAIYHMIHSGTLDQALIQSKKSGNPSELLVFTNGRGDTLIYNPTDGTKIYMREARAGQVGRATITYADGTQVCVDSTGRRTIKNAAGIVTDIDAHPDSSCRLPQGMSLGADGKLHLQSSGILIDRDCCLSCHGGMKIDLRHNQVHTGSTAEHTHAVLTNRSANTVLNCQDGSSIKIEQSGQVITSTNDGQTLTFDPIKHELKTAAGIFTQHEISLWTGQIVSDNGQVQFANGDKIAADGAVSFKDGTSFAKDGSVKTGDGHSGHCDYAGGPTTHDQLQSAYTRAVQVEGTLAGKSDFEAADLGALENSIGEISGYISMLSSHGMYNAVARLDSLRAQLESTLERARQITAIHTPSKRFDISPATVSDLGQMAG